MSQAMLRGLVTFIGDVRAAKSVEEEKARIDTELHKIRNKFLKAKGKGLDSYSARKYVGKILYIYMLGYPELIDFGHMESVGLISGSTYSEKQMGYLAVSLLITENSELVRLIINSIRNDLISAKPSDDVAACLALAATANIGGREMAEALSPVVQELLFSQNTAPMVKKKAALCMLRFFRRWPEMLVASEFAEPLVRLIDARHLGVTMGAMSLLLSLVSHDAEGYKSCVRQAIWLLDKLVLQGEAKAGYFYYDVPAPWLQVKLLRLLQYYPAPEDRNMHARLVQVLGAILSRVETDARPNHIHAVQCVLFEAIDLVIHLDTAPELTIQAAKLLGKFVTSKVTNTRYLGLAKMAHMAAANHDTLEIIRRYQKTIIKSLRDADISIRRRALDLVYSMCDSSNCEAIVGELLDYLGVAEHEIKDELVLKIAILAEKYPPHPNWYFDTILTLISLGGDHVSDDIWFRAVQIVTNNEDLQGYAAKQVFDALCYPSASDIVVKIGGYILGEYGHLLVDDGTTSPGLMFNLLHSKFAMSEAKTKAILLTAYSKMVNLFPELKGGADAVFNAHRSAMNADIQQRASEYMVLSNGSDDLLNVVWEMMPAFPERESAVVVHARKLEERGRTDKGPVLEADDDGDDDLDLAGVSVAPAAAASTAPSTAAPASLIDMGGAAAGSSSGASPAGSSLAPAGASEILIDNPAFLGALKFSNTGMLYEEAGVIKVGYKGEFKNNLARVTLFFINETGGPMAGFSAVAVNHESFNVSVPEPLTSIAAGATQVAQVFLIETTAPFAAPLLIKVSWDGEEGLGLALPLFPSKFVAQYPMDGATFLAAWNAVPADAQKMAVLKPHDDAGAASTDSVAAAISSLGLAVLQGVDPTPTNVVAGGMWCSTQTKAPILVRVEVSATHGLYRVTFRCGEASVAGEVWATIVKKVGVVQA